METMAQTIKIIMKLYIISTPPADSCFTAPNSSKSPGRPSGILPSSTSTHHVLYCEWQDTNKVTLHRIRHLHQCY